MRSCRVGGRQCASESEIFGCRFSNLPIFEFDAKKCGSRFPRNGGVRGRRLSFSRSHFLATTAAAGASAAAASGAYFHAALPVLFTANRHLSLRSRRSRRRRSLSNGEWRSLAKNRVCSQSGAQFSSLKRQKTSVKIFFKTNKKVLCCFISHKKFAYFFVLFFGVSMVFCHREQN